MLRAQPYLDLLYVTDARGRQTTSNIAVGEGFATAYGNDGFGMDWSSRRWFTEARSAGRSCVSDLYRSAATGTFCFTVSAALRRASGEVVGVLGADVSFERLVR